jgi:SAM-dependent methyltransferase
MATIETENDVFFSGIYKQIWKNLQSPGLTVAEVNFIEKVFELEIGNGVILDLMCGYGRHSLILAERGYNVVSIDNNSDYIQELQNSAIELKGNIKTVHANLKELQLDQNYDHAICMGNSLNFFDRNELTEILKGVSRRLPVGGKFVFNSWTIAEIVFRYFKEFEWYYAGNLKNLIENKFFFSPARIESVHTILDSDKVISTLNAIEHVYSISDLKQMFLDAQFELQKIYSIPLKRDFTLGDTQAYFIFEKITL